jgi:hypothetical protein
MGRGGIAYRDSVVAVHIREVSYCANVRSSGAQFLLIILSKSAWIAVNRAICFITVSSTALSSWHVYSLLRPSSKTTLDSTSDLT